MIDQGPTGCEVHLVPSLNKADVVDSSFIEPDWTDLFAPMQPLCSQMDSVNLTLDQNNASVCMDTTQGNDIAYLEPLCPDMAPQQMNIMQGMDGQFLQTAGRPLICLPLSAQALANLQGDTPFEPLASHQLDDIPPVLFPHSMQHATNPAYMDQLEPNTMSFGLNQTMFSEMQPMNLIHPPSLRTPGPCLTQEHNNIGQGCLKLRLPDPAHNNGAAWELGDIARSLTGCGPKADEGVPHGGIEFRVSIGNPNFEDDTLATRNIKSKKTGACRVFGCETFLASASRYAKRHRICELHLKSMEVPWKGKLQRFCQKCTRFQELSQFDGARRSCRKGLTLQRTRRTDVKPGANATEDISGARTGNHDDSKFSDLPKNMSDDESELPATTSDCGESTSFNQDAEGAESEQIEQVLNPALLHETALNQRHMTDIETPTSNLSHFVTSDVISSLPSSGASATLANTRSLMEGINKKVSGGKYQRRIPRK